MKIRYISSLAIITFLLHLVWENAQAPLFVGYQSFYQHIIICSIGTIGDVIITFFVFAFMSLLKIGKEQTTRDFLALAVIGFIVAVMIEQHALLAGSWSYAIAMPIIPWLKVGLFPVVQMTLLLPLSFYLTGLFNRK